MKKCIPRVILIGLPLSLTLLFWTLAIEKWPAPLFAGSATDNISAVHPDLAFTQTSERGLPQTFPTIERSDDPTRASLRIDGVAIFDLPNAHLGQHRLSADGRYLATVTTPTGAESIASANVLIVDLATAKIIQTIEGHAFRWVEAAVANSAALQSQPSIHYPTIEVDRYDSEFLVERIHVQLQSHLNGLAGQHTFVETRRESLSIHSEAADSPWHRRGLQSSIANAELEVTYPESIRVFHHADNECRDLPVGEVSVVPFEEYVAKVVSSEVPASWSLEALKAQAVAVRTYAWYQILVGRQSYDVTDWANFQYMCDSIYERPGQAASETAGLYLTTYGTTNGAPILAMYSAENSHPTLTNPNVTYLQSVPDLYSIGQTRFGHGYGLSQWGAQRRALDGQGFAQILGHYYSGVHLRNAAAPTQTIASFVVPESDQSTASAAVQWRLITSESDIFDADPMLPSNGLTGTVAMTAPLTVQPSVSVNISTSRQLTFVQRISVVVPITPTQSLSTMVQPPSTGLGERPASTSSVYVGESEGLPLTQATGLTGTQPLTTIVSISTTRSLTQPLSFSSAEGVWLLPDQLQDGDLITISVTARTSSFDESGVNLNIIEEQVLDQRILQVDRIPPAPPTITAIEAATAPLLASGATTAQARAVTDVGSAVVISSSYATVSGTISISSSLVPEQKSDVSVATRLEWQWEGEALLHSEGSGQVLTDGQASNGQAWLATAQNDQPGIWYGPYTNALPPKQAYRAIFWLKAPISTSEELDTLLSPQIIARLDVTDAEGRKVLGLHDLRLGDFHSHSIGQPYSPVAVDFYVFEPTEGIEFRTSWYGNHTLALDRIEVWTLPTPVESDFAVVVNLDNGYGEERGPLRLLSMAAFDQAGKISTVSTDTISAIDLESPTLSNITVPSSVSADEPFTLSVHAEDSFSGLDIVNSLLEIDDGRDTITKSVTLSAPSNPWRRQTLKVVLLEGLTEGVYETSFIIHDRAGNIAASEKKAVAVGQEPTYQQYVPIYYQ